jgi:hypothetical protein
LILSTQSLPVNIVPAAPFSSVPGARPLARAIFAAKHCAALAAVTARAAVSAARYPRGAHAL